MHRHGPIAGGSTLTCPFGTLTQGATRTITLTSPTEADDCGPIPNTAEVRATEDQATDGDNDDDGQITVSCPDITVVKTGSGTVTAGAASPVHGRHHQQRPGNGEQRQHRGVDTLPNGDLDWVIATRA